MKGLFNNAKSFNKPLDSWNVCSVTDMSKMFYEAENYNQCLKSWNLFSLNKSSDMFWGTKSLYLEYLDDFSQKNYELRILFEQELDLDFVKYWEYKY